MLKSRNNMASFSAKERLIANMLSAFPGFKQTVKKVYITLNAILYKKSYKEKVFVDGEGIKTIWNGEEESFFGYYDKCPENSRGDVLVHLTKYKTSKTPSADHSIKIAVIRNDGQQIVIGETYSYNWQQGARAMWLTDDLVIFNAFEQDKYVAKVYNIKDNRIVKIYNRPIQETNGKDYFLSINYRRIMSVRPDYGYRNLQPLSVPELKCLDDAGIVKVDFATGKEVVLHSMDEILNVSTKEIFSKCIHVVNHLMVSPKGTGLVFVHRYYEGKRRHDRLMYSDSKNLTCLLDDDMVSHYCWLNDDCLFGYVRVNRTDGFYTINVKTGKIVPCEALNSLRNGDGHPSYYDGKIVVDTYPDKSRMQHLMILDIETQKVIQIAEVFQSVRYMNETRCDMHPRFGYNGKSVYFDSVYSGKRTLNKVFLSD